MNKNVIIAVIAVLVLGAGGYFIMSQNSASQQMEEDKMMAEESGEDAMMEGKEDAMMKEDSEDSMMEDDKMMAEGEVVEFEVTGNNFAFDPNTMTVNKGDTVRIVFNNPDTMPHDWVIDEFNARTQILQTGESETIEFVADEAGEFEFYCSVGQHRANGMFGTLTVN